MRAKRLRLDLCASVCRTFIQSYFVEGRNIQFIVAFRLPQRAHTYTFTNSVLPLAADSAHWLAGWLVFVIPTHFQHLNRTKTIRVPPKTYYLLIKFNVFCIKPKDPFIYLWQKADGDVESNIGLCTSHMEPKHTPRIACSRYWYVWDSCLKSILHIYNLKWEPAHSRQNTSDRQGVRCCECIAESCTNSLIKHAECTHGFKCLRIVCAVHVMERRCQQCTASWSDGIDQIQSSLACSMRCECEWKVTSKR